MSITLAEVVTYSGGGFLLLLTLVQVAPIKLNPWGAFASWLGKALNADVLKEIQELKQQQEQTNTRLEKRVQVEDERNADALRENILRFNVELMRNLPHTREDFIEVLTKIDEYERYCKEHPEYPNSRAVHAVANINRVYDERLAKNDFYKADE
ncbi:MAG: conserved oligomeric Golgi complex subunit 3 [Clostridiales bacterium]|nr:conserved oligomeric Golgi complex subunit 3 [Clostridiales bacterium]